MTNIEYIKSLNRVLLICESPNKVKTISSILRRLGINNCIVIASCGHITRIADVGEFNLGIHAKTFEMNLEITEDKKDIVKKNKGTYVK